MSGMHLMPVYYSTTSTRRRKKKKKTASVLEAERQHEKFLKKMGVKRSVAQSGSASALGAEGQGFKSSHSDQLPLSNDIPVGVTPKRKIHKHNFTIAPAYNKGAYQVISKKDIKDIGR
jgi:hypothetical protein|tara:strand:+ start:994 stop:1347 length:354 start_codon:yes stop_codon:yes gene_type:complete